MTSRLRSTEGKKKRQKRKNSVGKQSPCLLSFVYMSYIKYGARAAPKFGNHASLFLYYKDKKYVQAIICSVILLSFSNICMLENIC